jgi:hypothetical protein
MRIYVLERVYDYMVNMGFDDETEVFEDILHCVVGFVCDHKVYGMDESLLGRGQSRKWSRIRAKYCSQECPEPYPTETEIFMGWKMAVREQLDHIWTLSEVLENLKLVAGAAKGEWESENGVSAGERTGVVAAAADAAEPACDAGLSGDGSAGGGCPGTEAGAAEAEYLDYGAEDAEAAADWISGAADHGLAQECGDEVGIPGPEPGEPSDKTGRVEGRKTSFGSLPPMSEYRTSLYAKGVCR